MGHNFYIDAKILFVKTSSLGDIIQAFHALSLLKSHFPDFQVDWVVEKTHKSLVSSHPLVNEAIEIDFRGWKKNLDSFDAWKKLYPELCSFRKRSYDFLFDLQGNTKSGVLSFLADAKEKIGFGPDSVREWPNLIATSKQFEIDQTDNICHQYESLIEQYFGVESKIEPSPFRLNITEKERETITQLPFQDSKLRIMVCPGSQWKNKQLDPKELLSLLKLMQERLNASFLLMWGNVDEKKSCDELNFYLKNSFVVDRLAIPVWQNLMWEVDLLLGVDSSALHLCSTTPTATFSFFGPTSLSVFKPFGDHHAAIQGECPYKVRFNKLCPRLRTCPSGACIRSLKAEELYQKIVSRLALKI